MTKRISEADLSAVERTYNSGGLPDCWVDLVGQLAAEVRVLRQENRNWQETNRLITAQARKDNDRAEMADTYERWLLEIGLVVGCQHLDEQLPNCIIRKLQGDA